MVSKSTKKVAKAVTDVAAGLKFTLQSVVVVDLDNLHDIDDQMEKLREYGTAEILDVKVLSKTEMEKER